MSHTTCISKTFAALALLGALAAGCTHDEVRHETTNQTATPSTSTEATATIAKEDTLLSAMPTTLDLHPDVRVKVSKGKAFVMQLDGMMLAAVDSAVLHDGTYTATALHEGELPALPSDHVNVTAGSGAGYRLLPGGEHFSPYAELRVAYDEGKLPKGYTPDDIHTSYYDTETGVWTRLVRKEVDTLNKEIVSLTTHFTDFVNEVLKAPEMPETQAFVPTMMSELEAANPLEGLTLIQPPTANNNGTANLSYPLQIPAGRQGMQPNLALTYNSGGGSSWLGVGWEIPVPSITLDTRWGVPRYSTNKETEIYLLDGEQLITKEADSSPRPMPHRTNQQTNRLPAGTQFYARTGDAHDSIIRHGDNTTNYWWEVVDRSGISHYYGHYADASRSNLPQNLCDDRGNIARWPICESRDLYGNTVRYYYDLSTVSSQGTKGRQLYLDSISYTGHGEDDGYYTVVFCRTVNPTTDIPVSCNNGFKEYTNQILNNVYVKCGDSILTAWLFDMENSYKTNYKNRLVEFSKIDSASIGMRKFLSNRCDCVRSDEDDNVLYIIRSIVNKDTIIGHDTLTIRSIPDHLAELITGVDEGYAGSTYQFSYHDAPEPENMFGPEVVSSDLFSAALHGTLLTDRNGDSPVSQATGLGLSHSSSWNVGGTASGGLDPAVCLTTVSLGGNYTRSQSSSESLMTLVDLDGDGLADKVYVQDGVMYFCRHIHHVDGTIEFDFPVEVVGASHFLEESSYSNTFGTQLAVGFSGGINWTNSKSTTSTYFADVNGDGLVDLVNNGQVLFNSLYDGYPQFSRYEEPLTEEEESEEAPVTTTASGCGGIIFDGEVNDSITCERIWVSDTSFLCDTITAQGFRNRYLHNTDTLVTVTPGGKGPNDVLVKRYHREWDCSYHDDSPSTEAVRVWIAPREGTIELHSEVWLKEYTSATRRAARHADGIVYTIQHTKGVTMSGKQLHGNSNSILRTFDICDTCYYVGNGTEYLYSYDSSFLVSKGDMLFFRLRSKESHQFDDVYDSLYIQYTDRDRESYDSRYDFVLSADYCFQAPVDGYYYIDGDLTDNSGEFDLEINAGVDSFYYGNSTDVWIFDENGMISKDETIRFTITNTDTDALWGQVKCRPHVIFIPNTTQVRNDTNPFTNETNGSRYLDTIEGWIPAHLDIVHKGIDTIYNRTLFRRLFGPLYKGWGQFAYHSLDTGAMADIIRVEKLIPPDMLVSGVSSPSDTTGFRSQIHSGDDLDSNELKQESTFDSFQASHEGLYNPLSNSSYWVEMTPDVEHQTWVSYGRQNYVGRDSISNSVQEQWYSSSVAVDETEDVEPPSSTMYDDPVPAAASDGTPAKAIRKVNRSVSQSWSVGAAGIGRSGSDGRNVVVTDYMDLNGDRYPDNIGIERVQYSQQWGGLGHVSDFPDDFANFNSSVTHSSGRSFGASPITQERTLCGSQGNALFTLKSEGSGSLSGDGNIGHDMASGSWIDINGDGLPDFLKPNGNVYLNVGYGFLKDGDWNVSSVQSGISGSVSGSASVSGAQTLSDNFFNVWQGSIQAGASISGSYNQTETMMIDINGDGLPDRVARTIPYVIASIVTGNETYAGVSFNQGNGHWAQAVPINIKRFHASTNYSESLNIGLTYGVTFWGVLKVTVGIDGCPYSGSVNRDYIQLVDVNADGLPDLVSSNSEESLTVRYNQGGRTNLLSRVTNFNGAYFNIEYTLSEPDYNQPSRSWLMTKVTTHDNLNSGNGATTTTTEYSYSNPHYDRYERTSYGYETVTSTQIDPNTSTAYRKIQRDYHNSNMLRRGRLKRELTYVDNATLYVEKTFDCAYVDYLDGDTLDTDSECPEICYPVHEAIFTTYYEGGATPLLTVGERFEYDRYHNVLKYYDLGDTNDHSDGVVATFHYYSGLSHNLIGLRKDYSVTSPTNASDTLRKARFLYDLAHGKMTRQVLYNGSDSAVYDFGYETTFGNLNFAMQPKNDTNERMTYSYTYDDVVNTYPTQIDNSYGETMITAYDYRFGKPLAVTDPTGSTMTYRYDFAGRLVSVNSPLNSSGIPSLVNQYHPLNYYHNGFEPQGYTYSASPTKHPYSLSKHYDDDGQLITETAVLTNGFGQAIQTKKGLKVGGTDMMQVSGRTVTDAFGRTIEQYDPVVESLSTHRGRYNTNFDATSLSTTQYDVLDRVTSTLQPLNVTTHTAYGIANDGSGHRRFVTAITDPNGNITTQYSDYEGRKVQVTDAEGGTTLMHYDNLGQLEYTSDPEGFTTSYRYDMFGRMTRRDHPDAGTTRYTYDNAGNLLQESNPLGQINYKYTYYRVLSKRYSNMTGNDVTYTYGTTGTETGRPVRIVDGSGMYQCQYDALGNVIDELRTIALPGNDEVYNFRMQYRYDSWGRMLGMTYPDGEEITYTYQWGGDLCTMDGNKNGNFRTYIHRIQYNIFGQKDYVEYGNTTSARFSYDKLHRLSNLRSYDHGGSLMQDIDYTFDDASNVTGIVNNASAVNTLGGSYENTYEYDALHRLVSSYGNGDIGGYNTSLAYSPSGRMTTKYCDNGSVTMVKTVDMAYGYCDDYQPHAVRRIYDNHEYKLYDLRWDDAGNLAQVSIADKGAIFESGRFLFWTEDSRLHTVVDDRYYSYYAYDHSGERRLKLTGESNLMDINADYMDVYTILDNPTLYPSAYMVLDNHGYTKHYYAGAERVAARIGSGNLDAIGNTIDNNDDLLKNAEIAFEQGIEQTDGRFLPENDNACIMDNEYAQDEFDYWIDRIPSQIRTEIEISIEQFKLELFKWADGCSQDESDVYFYHSDHLGSASWITDNHGDAIQHIQYLPYGEPYINQRLSGYNERFTFTGKELDAETGYGYFGARYMDHELMTMWLSVDPMADKYPSLSPYNYCAWNPVKLFDPDGREIYYTEGGDTYVYKKGQDGNYGFFNKQTGEAYSGNNSQYVSDLTSALGELKEGCVGAKLVGFFEGSKHDVEIADGSWKKDEFQNSESEQGVSWSNTKRALLPIAKSINDKVQLEETEPFVSLGHELAHHRDRLKVGSNNYEQWSRERRETSAMLWENLIRREHYMSQRTYYGSTMVNYGGGSIKLVDYNSYKAITFPGFPKQNSLFLNCF